MNTINININWNSEKSIELAELQKEKLENDGYTQINTFGGLSESVLVYALLERN